MHRTFESTLCSTCITRHALHRHPPLSSCSHSSPSLSRHECLLYYGTSSLLRIDSKEQERLQQLATGGFLFDTTSNRLLGAGCWLIVAVNDG